MKNDPNRRKPVLTSFWQIFLIAGALIFLYTNVLPKLFQTWWTDENYTHGLLIPFVIGYLLWSERKHLTRIESRPEMLIGGALVILAIAMLILGTLGAELFTQRVSLVLIFAGMTIYFFGWLMLRFLVVPLTLLALAIPIPAIIWNKIAFPLQLLATDLAVFVIRIFAVPVVKFGNIIELLPRGAMQVVQFEVVEACSGIRSLMTLVTLALVYAFFTRRFEKFENRSFWRNSDFWRALFLMLAALPIAVVTNAARVAATVLIAFYYGKETADGFLHDFSGWFVYLAALLLLFAASLLFDAAIKIFKKNGERK